jgi:hypothetical protein
MAPTIKTFACSQTGLVKAARTLQSKAAVRQAVWASERLLLVKMSFSAYAACRYFFKNQNWIKSSKELPEKAVDQLVAVDGSRHIAPVVIEGEDVLILALDHHQGREDMGYIA